MRRDGTCLVLLAFFAGPSVATARDADSGTPSIFENRGHAPSIELPDEFNRAHLAFLNVLHDSTARTDRMELNLA